MNFEAYTGYNTALTKSSKSVAMKSMNDAATEVKSENPDTITKREGCL